MSFDPNITKHDFIAEFNRIAPHKHRYEVFQDFVCISAFSLHNAVNKVEKLEEEYLKIINPYKAEDLERFCKLLDMLVTLLEPEPRDILGGIYMELDLGNGNSGQFFTPPEISLMMASLLYGDDLKEISKPYITFSEPASGSGGMILAFVKIMLENGHNPADKIWVQAVDVDRTVALMCYIQLSLWNVPAEVVVGNSLSLEVREVFYTPAHYLNGWSLRLLVHRLSELVKPTSDSQNEEKSENLAVEVSLPDDEELTVESKPQLIGENLQFDF